MEPANLGAALDKLERDLAEARIAEINAKQEWQFREAARRGAERAAHEADGVRHSCADVEATIIVERNDPATPIGKAWLAYNESRAERLRTQAEHAICDRANWTAIRDGRMGP